MVRIQLHLTEQQDRRLRTRARKEGTTRAELIRRGIELVLSDQAPASDALLGLIGSAGAGPHTNLSEDHDRLLYQIEEASLPIAADKK